MKKLNILLLFMIMNITYSQVGIGTDRPIPGSDLTLGSNNKGLRLNLVNLDSENDVKIGGLSPGMIVYNTNSIDGMTPGLYINNGTIWDKMVSNQSFMELLKTTSYTIKQVGFWKVNGNADINPAESFIGTKDNNPIVFKTNDQTRLFIDTIGNTGLGTNNPTEKLDVVGNIKLSNGIITSNGSGNVGQVLTSDGTGKTIWKDPTAGQGTTQPATTSALGTIQLAGDLTGTAIDPIIADGKIGSSKITDGTLENIDLKDGTGGIYKSDGSLTTDRKVNQADKKLAFISTSVDAFSVDGTTLSVDAANNSVGVGTNAPNSSAALEINSTNKGFLLPRITTSARNAITSTSPRGMQIFNTDTDCIEVNTSKGWYNPCEYKYSSGVVSIPPPPTSYNGNKFGLMGNPIYNNITMFNNKIYTQPI